ncbi:hypothetical protein [Segetibacter aerophilus]|uniref:Uncharacterized protein n=1 Tax=Segetibacter aerophilus TaxID=670293 RepID=A0A512BCJ0_9BACT|nr:hypothetical protein [Segetibacter aerophilus]GEO09682.1 hypothetical protein SAE01_21780 [Segetibacter aerophilus]
MIKQFLIKKVCSEANRPPYSYKVEEYFEEFVHNYILQPFNIILNEKWKVLLSIMLFKKDDNSPQGVNIYEASLVEEELIKYYPVAITLDDIYANDKPMENIVGLYYKIISLFFLSNYPGISQQYMLDLKEKLDWEYLLSLTYPAPYSEQKYVGD